MIPGVGDTIELHTDVQVREDKYAKVVAVGRVRARVQMSRSGKLRTVEFATIARIVERSRS